MMKERLKEISQKAREQILGAASIQDAEALRVEYLGKKGKLTDMLKSMKDL
ncbi:MAG: phenylalanine--tRNA ligase subunit alpha, partial [Firmicutes bacterium]|nr:phenylalanine--tRNA ligase subunit alpha [Bacillota bacterium]